MTNKFLTLFLLIAFGQALFAQNAQPQKILFVGNSYTYFWNLPQSVMGLAAEKNIDLEIKQSTAGGANLGQHWRGEKELETVSKISKGDFDIVILQDYSLQAIQKPDSLMYYGKLMGNHVKQSGAQPYLYMTWAREWDPYMQEPITKGYTSLAKKINATIVPVGLAWQRARELRPDLKLYDPDGSHPSPTGTYLTACVFFRVLTGQSPVGLPPRINHTDKDGEKLYLNIQNPGDAQFCQKVADEVVREMEE